MRLGLNLLYLIPESVGGTETYARELIPHLAKDHELIIFCGRETGRTITPTQNIRVVTLPLNSSNRFLRLLAEQTLLPVLALFHRVDVFFSLGYSAPVLHHCPSVVTIHDLNWYYHPEDFSALNRFVWKYLTILSARFSTHVITISRASALAITQILKIPKSKVTPILHGTPSKLETIPSKSTHPYLFTVVANYPHKNLSTLLQALNLLSHDFPELDLIVCGLGKHPRSTKRIKYLGYVGRAELASLYAGASIFVFPSAYEGFGIPVLEAMSYGAPVVSSNAFSLKEVVAHGGLLVDPYDVTAYVTAVTQIMTKPKLRADLVKRGYSRSRELKWEDTAKRTISVLEGSKQS